MIANAWKFLLARGKRAWTDESAGSRIMADAGAGSEGKLS